MGVDAVLGDLAELGAEDAGLAAVTVVLMGWGGRIALPRAWDLVPDDKGSIGVAGEMRWAWFCGES